jgi:tetratricopeptide (TPR) repeat protein
MKTNCFSLSGLVLSSLLLVTTSASCAEALRGAEAVLQTVAAQSGKKVEAAKPSEIGKLRSDLEAFGKTNATLPADDAAKQWLALADRFFALSAQARARYEEAESLNVQQLIGALPPPPAWEALAKAVGSRPAAKKGEELREAGLRLLVAALQNDKAARDREIRALQARAENAPRSETYVLRNLFEQLNETLLESMDDADAVLKSLEYRLARSGGAGRGPQQLRLPNLVALVGEPKAEEFLRKALTTTSVALDIEGANATSTLARKLALELMEQLKSPQWALVDSLDAVELFEAMDKKFTKPKAAPTAPVVPDLLDVPGDDSGDYRRSQAETYYFLGLISKGRAKDAVAVAQRLARNGRGSLPHDGLRAMERAGYTKALDDFFSELLTQDASLPFWDEYVQLAAKAGRTERMLKLARTAAADESMTKKKRSSIHQNLFRALLADGQIEEGVTELKRLLAQEPSPSASAYEEMSKGQLGLMLARLGILLKKAEWTEEGIKAAQASLTNAPQSRWDYSSRAVPAGLAGLLFEQGRAAEAETILTEALAKAARSTEGREDMSDDEGETTRPLLVALASLYHRANRPADVLALLDQAPYWGAKDTVNLLEDFSGMDGAFFSMRMQVRAPGEQLPIAYVAASALAAQNKASEARALNTALLGTYPGYDRAYELLLKLDGENASARLDELFARDQFEERPLIWKTRLLADKKDWAAAEEVVKRAIAIDPSDGEQGPGDRMRAYALLAEIREARGDQKDATFFRNVVKAIRMSEEADQYYAVGLLKRAVAMYTESLKLFSDAYCIQSRLAIQLAELGLHEEAEAHYRRAYELMPDSFGRVESHCFGCERAFDGQRAQSLAEKVFTELAAKQPKKPQVHYLLGYLRMEESRHAEAVPHFKTAVTLDPEYLNAWQKLLEAGSHVRMAPSERDNIALNILRLDPGQRHAHADLRRISDLRALWNAVEAANKLRPTLPASIYPLASSKAAIEKQETSGARSNRHRFVDYMEFGLRGQRQNPGVTISQTAFVQSAGQLLSHVSFE